ncbi:MAG: hypothetical protein C5B54_05715 [Acidobacteria bacterium]|nr:MAG: hypothetical protein C5B54_05715 [Acidobacteriota bacterium]
MQDLLIIPTYDRPEFLWWCLDHLMACPEITDLQVRLHIDHHHRKPPPLYEIREVLWHFPRLHLHVYICPSHTFAGNSYNVMMAYQEAYRTQARYVFMVEDDVLVAPQFFQWHRQVQATEAPVCSMGVRRPSHGSFVSLGVCFPREELIRLLTHCRIEYFTQMEAYCRRVFPPSSFGTEQDGLWARLLAHEKLVWADPPLVQHVGWYGYHRTKSRRPAGSVGDRYRMIQRVLASPTALQEWVKDFHDIDVRPLR